MTAIKPGRGCLGVNAHYGDPCLYFDASGGNVNAAAWSLFAWFRYNGSQRQHLVRVEYGDGHLIRAQTYNWPGWTLYNTFLTGYGRGDVALDGGWHSYGLTFEEGGGNLAARLYLDGGLLCEHVGAGSVGAAVPHRLYLNRPTQDATCAACWYRWLIAWDAALAEADFAALHAAGRDYLWPDRDLPSLAPSRTLLASWMHGPDADEAVGDPVLHQDTGAGGDPTTWAWIPLGPDEEGIVLDCYGGEPAHGDSATDPIPLWCALGVDVQPDEVLVGSAAKGRQGRMGGWSDIVSASDTGHLKGFDGGASVIDEIMDGGDGAWRHSWGLFRLHVFAGTKHLWNPTSERWEATATVEAVPGASTRRAVHVGPGAYQPGQWWEGQVGAVTSASEFEVDGLPHSADADWWRDAYLLVMSGDARGQMRRVAGQSGATVALDAALTAAPATGDDLNLVHGHRLWLRERDDLTGLPVNLELLFQGQRRGVGFEHVWHDGGYRSYTRLEGGPYCFAGDLERPYQPPYLRFGVPPRGDADVGNDLYQVGYTRYAIGTGQEAKQRLDELYDSFLIPVGEGHAGVSSRAPMSSNVERVEADGTRHANQLGEFTAAGTWRDSEPWLTYVEWDGAWFRGLMEGVGAEGTRAFGWVRFRWDEAASTFEVEDDPAASNPQFSIDELHDSIVQSGAHIAGGMVGLAVAAFPTTSGYWALMCGLTDPGEDGNGTVFVQGVPGWRTRHDIDLTGRVEVTGTSYSPLEGDTAPWGGSAPSITPANRDASFWLCRNRYVPPGYGRSYYLTGRAQIHPSIGRHLSLDATAGHEFSRRVLASAETDDGRGLVGWPVEDGLIAPSDPNFHVHYPRPWCHSREVRSAVTDNGTGVTRHVYLMSTETGWRYHTARRIVDGGSAPDGHPSYAPVAVFQDDSRDYVLYCRYPYYRDADSDWGVLYWDRDGAVYVWLSDTETSGWFATPVLIRPDDGWEELSVNWDRGDGDLAVEVRDPLAMEATVAGYDVADCDQLAGGLQEQVTWQGNSLSDLDEHNVLRLVFHLTRPVGTDNSPQLRAWWAGDGQRTYHQVVSGAAWSVRSAAEEGAPMSERLWLEWEVAQGESIDWTSAPLTDGVGNVLDLMGATVVAKIKAEWQADAVVGEFWLDETLFPQGRIRLVFEDTDGLEALRDYHFDVHVALPPDPQDGDRVFDFKPARGVIHVLPGVSQPTA
ncbi:MAG: hypothetical protein U9R79_22890 [Armatimonadota bacterium]|nr:hypothetical protein [Armatimonadota bacterium]